MRSSSFSGPRLSTIVFGRAAMTKLSGTASKCTADQLGVALVARICLDPERVVVFDSDGHSGAAAPAGGSHDVGVTVREQEEVASLQPERLPAIPFQEATSLRHDMKLGPAGRLRFVHGVPLRSKPAHFHADRISHTKALIHFRGSAGVCLAGLSADCGSASPEAACWSAELAITCDARQSPTSIKPELVVVCGRPWCQATLATVAIQSSRQVYDKRRI
jgi:hypothetical protein